MQSDSAPTIETLRWLPITAAVSSISVVGIAIGLGTPLLSIILETRGYSASMIGLNTAVAGFATIAAAPLSTPLATRFGVVWTMLAMIVVGALSAKQFGLAVPAGLAVFNNALMGADAGIGLVRRRHPDADPARHLLVRQVAQNRGRQFLQGLLLQA